MSNIGWGLLLEKYRLIRSLLRIFEEGLLRYLFYINCGYVGNQTSQKCRKSPSSQPRPSGILRNSQAHRKVMLAKVSDCTFMQLRSQSLTPNIFLHNVRELLEKMAIGEEGLSLAEMMELSLLNQSTTLSSIILSQNDFDLELAINLGILMDKRVISTH